MCVFVGGLVVVSTTRFIKIIRTDQPDSTETEHIEQTRPCQRTSTVEAKKSNRSPTNNERRRKGPDAMRGVRDDDDDCTNATRMCRVRNGAHNHRGPRPQSRRARRVPRDDGRAIVSLRRQANTENYNLNCFRVWRDVYANALYICIVKMMSTTTGAGLFPGRK